MKVYTTDKIRNVALLGHIGSGKTSLVEAMAYLAKATAHLGSIENGSTISDFNKEEINRKISLKTSLIPLEWKDYKINILDTPGHVDFIGEVEEALAVSDNAIIVVDGKTGVNPMTKMMWDMCEKRKIPRMVYVTNMDIDNASFKNVVEDMTALYGKKMAPLHFPIRENEKFVGYVNVISRSGHRWVGSEVQDMEVPEYSKENLEKYRNVLVEAVAETSEEMLDRYLAGEEFSEAEIRSSLKYHVWDNSIVPMSMGSSTLLQGMYVLLDDIIKYGQSPDKKEVVGINKNTNEIFKANNNFSLSKSMFVWKTMNDPYIGKYSFIKINSGVIKNNDVLYNANNDIEEKVGKVYTLFGNKQIEVGEMHAGDIGVLQKLSNTKTFDTLSTKQMPIIYSKPEMTKPYTFRAYSTEKKEDIDKLAQAMAKICEEDTTIRSENDVANHQMLLYGVGASHIDIIKSILENEYKVKINVDFAKIAFKETILKNSDEEYKYKKQSGGHGQYGHVKIRFSPSGDYEVPFVFTSEVVGGAVPKNYFPAVEKGLKESCEEGPLAGYPVVGLNAVLYDGSYHEVDSSEMAFKVATIGCFKEGFMKASPTLLEPIVDMKVVVEDEYTGDIVGNLNKRRGRILGMNSIGCGKSEIECEIPLDEIADYSTELRSQTRGMGTYCYAFVRYEQAPKDVIDKQIELYASKKKDD